MLNGPSLPLNGTASARDAAPSVMRITRAVHSPPQLAGVGGRFPPGFCVVLVLVVSDLVLLPHDEFRKKRRHCCGTGTVCNLACSAGHVYSPPHRAGLAAWQSGRSPRGSLAHMLERRSQRRSVPCSCALDFPHLVSPQSVIGPVQLTVIVSYLAWYKPDPQVGPVAYSKVYSTCRT